MRRLLSIIFFALVQCQWASSLWAQAYPSRPIKIVVPTPPGGPADAVARMLADKLSVGLGQPVVIDNRPGAGGNIGAELVARAKADGYTVLFGHNGIFSINPWLYQNLGYQASKDFVPVSQVGSISAMVMVTPALPVKTLGELVALAKETPGAVAYGSAGIGTPQHINGEVFKVIAGVNMLHVPHQGSVAAVTGLINGQPQVGFEFPFVVSQMVHAGRIRALAIAGPKRVPLLPDVPTAAEAGLPGFEGMASWSGYFVPTGTPRDVVLVLHREIVKAVNSPEFIEFARLQGTEVVGSTPDEFAKFIAAEGVRWEKVVKATAATVE